MEPLREEWRNVLAATETKRAAGDLKGAIAELRGFHERLCAVRVLDPASGTGNFLYVSMALMKELEGEVLDALALLSDQTRFHGYELRTIDPHQFLGMELNPRAAAIAELVLWIGYLQWHFRIRGGTPPEPILREFRNIQEKNAVLTWNDAPRIKVQDRKEQYTNARRPEWPEADFIVGNPPFIGAKFLRERLGSDYVDALWRAHPHINESADFVMYWWDRAAELLVRETSRLRRFGFVTTNSVTQEFSGRVIKRRMEDVSPLSLVMAISDHPWTKALPDSAAVRIAMTVVEKGEKNGILYTATSETALDTDQPLIEFIATHGRINPNLTIGADLTSAIPLRSNAGICSPGVKLHGDGFIVTVSEAEHLGWGRVPGLEEVIRPYRHGRDITHRPRGVMVIDLFGFSADEVRKRFPKVYQHLLQEVKEKKDSKGKLVGRDANHRVAYRTNWWLFGEPRSELREALAETKRFIVTPVTSKNRFFQFLETSILPDDALMSFALEGGFALGVLSSSVFAAWFDATGSTLEDRPRFIKSRCFDPYPFPETDQNTRDAVAEKAEEIDAFRKERQREHPELTLSGLYTVLDKLRWREELTAAESTINEIGLARVLGELHDELDDLVFRAYGWSDRPASPDIVARLLRLNRTRAAQEDQGVVLWVRPDFQLPRFGKAAEKRAAAAGGLRLPLMSLVPAKHLKRVFPEDSVSQTAEVFAVLTNARQPLNAAMIAANFKQGKKIESKISAVLESLARLGHTVKRENYHTLGAFADASAASTERRITG